MYTYNVNAVFQFLYLGAEQFERVLLAVLTCKGRRTCAMNGVDPVFQLGLRRGLEQVGVPECRAKCQDVLTLWMLWYGLCYSALNHWKQKTRNIVLKMKLLPGTMGYQYHKK